MTCTRGPTTHASPPQGGPAEHRDPHAPSTRSCATLAARLRARLPEWKRASPTSSTRSPDPHDLADPTYLTSLNAIRPAILEYIIDVIERGERRAPGIPPAVLARPAWPLALALPSTSCCGAIPPAWPCSATILAEEAEHAEVSSSILRRLLRRQAAVFDRLLQTVSEEYIREAKSRPTTTAEWRREYIKGLLAGRQPSGDVELSYDLDGHHLGLMAKGEGAEEGMRELAKRLDRRLLAGRREEEPVGHAGSVAGAGSRPKRRLRVLGDIALDRVARHRRGARRGLSGWRLSHHQAEAALPIAERGGQPSSATPTSPCRHRSCATTSSPPRCASSTWSRSRERGTAARCRGRPCAPTSPPSGTSPRPLQRWAWIVARSRIEFAPSRTSSVAPSRTSRRILRSHCDWTIDEPFSET